MIIVDTTLRAVADTVVATHGAIDVSVGELAIAFGLVAIAIALAAWQRIGLARGFLIGAIRAVVQLTIVGYVLVYLFAVRRWYLVLLAMLVMLVVATKTATDRQRAKRREVFVIAGVAMLVGAGLTLAYVDMLVVRARPWYDPQYLIPLFGMIIGNSMNGAALVAERLTSEIAARRPEIEAYLALGATSARAARSATRAALTASLIPAVNGLMVVGLVALPGMMTGQILAGSSPLLAIRYQIVVAFMLAGAVAVTVTIVAIWYRSTFFNSSEQLIDRVAV